MKKELLFSITKKDLTIQTFRSGGKGGQHQNKRESGVRIIHKASKCVGESREERSQYANKKIAFRRLTKNPKFKMWINRRAYEIVQGKRIEDIVEEQMEPLNLKVEVVDEAGKWTAEVSQEK